MQLFIINSSTERADIYPVSNLARNGPMSTGRALPNAQSPARSVLSRRVGCRIMQLTMRDASTFLQVAEPTLRRWINERGLPNQNVGGQFRFNRLELLEWARANEIPVSLDTLDDLLADHEQGPSLVAALDAGGIFPDLKNGDKNSTLRALVEVLPLPAQVDREWLLRLFLAREDSATMAIGDGIALPQIRNPIVLDVDRPMITLCFLARPVDFGARDRKPVHVLFSLVCPTVRSHLRLLSRLSHALQDEAFKQVVLRHAPRDQILAEAQRAEEALAASE